MNKLNGEDLFEEYMHRVFDTNIDLEDVELEAQWLQSRGWTIEEFDKFLADNPWLGE